MRSGKKKSQNQKIISNVSFWTWNISVIKEKLVTIQTIKSQKTQKRVILKILLKDFKLWKDIRSKNWYFDLSMSKKYLKTWMFLKNWFNLKPFYLNLLESKQRKLDSIKIISYKVDIQGKSSW